MSIQFSSLPNTFLAHNILPSWAVRPKNIFIVVSAVFACIAVAFVIKKIFFTAKILNGQGELKYPNGTVAKGLFKNGQLNGYGAIIEKDGTTWEGRFTSNQPMDSGKMTLSSGIEGEATYVDVALNQEGSLSGQIKIFIDELDYTLLKDKKIKFGSFSGTGEVSFYLKGMDTLFGPSIWDGTFQNGEFNGTVRVKDIPDDAMV